MEGISKVLKIPEAVSRETPKLKDSQTQSATSEATRAKLQDSPAPVIHHPAVRVKPQSSQSQVSSREAPRVKSQSAQLQAVSNEVAKVKPQSAQSQAVANEVANGNQASPAAQPIKPAEVKQTAAELTKALQQQNSDLSVSVDETTGTMVVRIMDNSTGEVVKQIPPKQFMEAKISMNNIVGLLIDNKV